MGARLPGAGPGAAGPVRARSRPRLLQRLDALAESQGRTGSLIEIRALRSGKPLQAAENHQGARTLLAETLALARPGDYIRVFADEGRPLAALLRSLISARQRGRVAAGSAGSTERLHRVVQAFRPARDQTGKATHAVPGLIEPLTARELEMLRLLA